MKEQSLRSLPLHGSPAGFEAGCSTRAACPLHGSETHLTCVEAAIRRRGDYYASRLPLGQPLLRQTRRATRELEKQEKSGGPDLKHGTPWGYQRGCRQRTSCPNWRAGKVTCADARRTYFREYKRRRREGAGSVLQHGTTAGYSAGCHDRNACGLDENGRSCADAWREYKIRRARKAGVNPRGSTDAHEARAAVLDMRARGHSVRSIALVTGVGRTTIGELLRTASRRQDRPFSRAVVDRILSASRVGGSGAEPLHQRTEGGHRA